MKAHTGNGTLRDRKLEVPPRSSTAMICKVSQVSHQIKGSSWIGDFKLPYIQTRVKFGSDICLSNCKQPGRLKGNIIGSPGVADLLYPMRPEKGTFSRLLNWDSMARRQGRRQGSRSLWHLPTSLCKTRKGAASHEDAWLPLLPGGWAPQLRHGLAL